MVFMVSPVWFRRVFQWNCVRMLQWRWLFIGAAKKLDRRRHRCRRRRRFQGKMGVFLRASLPDLLS